MTEQRASITRPSGERVTINAPARGEHAHMAAPKGGEIALTAAVAGALFERDGNDLVISIKDEGSITLTDLFVQEQGNAPDFVLPDGSVVDFAAFLEAQNPDLDLTTAAGLSASTASSGVNSYADDASDLIGGTEKLGSLGTDQWSARSRSAVETPMTAPFAGTEMAIVASIPQTPSTPEVPGPGGSDEVLYGRMVMYINDNAGNSQLESYLDYNAAKGSDYQFGMVHEAQQGGADTSKAPSSQHGFGTVGFDAQGRLIYTTTTAGLNALNEPDNAGRVIDYVTYVDGNGVTRVVQVVLTSDMTFATSGIDGEPVEYETHFSHAGLWTNTAYNIISTGGDDVLELESAISRADLASGMNQTTIHTGDGNDKITVSSGFKSANALLSYQTYGKHDQGLVSIDTGTGNDTLNLVADNMHLGASATNAHGYHAGGGSWSGDGRLQINMGDGDDVFNVTVNTMGTASGILDYNNAGTASVIDLGDGNDLVNINVYGSRYATGLEYGVNIKAGDGDDTVNITARGDSGKNYALQGEGGMNQRPVIEMGDGDDSLHLSGITVNGDARGSNGAYLYGEEGNDTFNIEATATGTGNATGMSGTYLFAGSGNDSINISAEAANGTGTGVTGGSSIFLGEEGEVLGDTSYSIDGRDFHNVITIHGSTTGMSDTRFHGSDGNDYVRISAGTGNAVQGSGTIQLGAGDDHLVVDGNYAASGIDMGDGNDLVELTGLSFGSIMGGAGDDTLILHMGGHGQDAFTESGLYKGLVNGEASVIRFEDIILDLTGGGSDTLEITDEMLSIFTQHKEDGDSLTIHVKGDTSGEGVDHVNTEYLTSNGWTSEYQGGNTVFTNPSEDVRLIIETGLM